MSETLATTAVPAEEAASAASTLLLATVAVLLGLFVIGVVLLARSQHRRMKRAPASPQTPGEKPPDAWQEAGRRLEAPPPDEDRP